MLYVQKDLSAVTKAIFDTWDARKDEINHRYLYVANARVTPLEILASVNKRKQDPGARRARAANPDVSSIYSLYPRSYSHTTQ